MVQAVEESPMEAPVGALATPVSGWTELLRAVATRCLPCPESTASW